MGCTSLHVHAPADAGMPVFPQGPPSNPLWRDRLIDPSRHGRPNPYKAHPVAAAVNQRTLGWALAFLAAGLVVLSGLVPGSDRWPMGPRIGMGTLLLVSGLILGVGAFAGAIRSRTDRVESKGGCPVGATCLCGHFNFKPRRTCRQCGAATRYAAV